jgi:hypothetical protein
VLCRSVTSGQHCGVWPVVATDTPYALRRAAFRFFPVFPALALVAPVAQRQLQFAALWPTASSARDLREGKQRFGSTDKMFVGNGTYRYAVSGLPWPARYSSRSSRARLSVGQITAPTPIRSRPRTIAGIPATSSPVRRTARRFEAREPTSTIAATTTAWRARSSLAVATRLALRLSHAPRQSPAPRLLGGAPGAPDRPAAIRARNRLSG